MVMDGGNVISQQANQAPPMHHASAPPPTTSETPNATRVAREFVRQYYTIMHESPVHLHRFYNDESDFFHDSEPYKVVRGQQEIHRTILALNFRDCHAKIRYVDAQESVNKSVVVQVAGELSNQGSPMRRFMQTFLLVPLSARKYYVRNDIFRYQDEVYESAEEDEVNANEVTNHQQLSSNMVNGGGDHGAINGSLICEANSGTPFKDECHEENNQWDNSVSAAAPNPQSPPHAQSPEGVPLVQESSAISNTAPRSWSQMLQTTSDSSPAAPAASSIQPTFGQPSSSISSNASNCFGQSSHGSLQKSSQAVRANSNTSGTRSSSSGPSPQKKDISTAQKDDESKHFVLDNQQLFIGNIPVAATEKEIKELFAKYGNVVEFYFGASKGPGNLAGKPNYGFLMFDSPEAAQKVLDSRPINYDERDGKPPVRLNIEERKRNAGGKGPRGGISSRGGRPPMPNGRRDFNARTHRPSGPPRQSGHGSQTQGVLQH